MPLERLVLSDVHPVITAGGGARVVCLVFGQARPVGWLAVQQAGAHGFKHRQGACNPEASWPGEASTWLCLLACAWGQWCH